MILVYIIFSIFRDILAIFKEPPPGIMALPDKDDMSRVIRVSALSFVFDVILSKALYCFTSKGSCPHHGSSRYTI